MPFDTVEYVGGYERGTSRLVATRRSRADGQRGFSAELYRRNMEANCWEEALRIDAMPDDLHFHAFPTDGDIFEASLDVAAGGPAALAQSVLAFLEGDGRDWIGRVGYGPDLADDASRSTEVVQFLKGRLSELGIE